MVKLRCRSTNVRDIVRLYTVKRQLENKMGVKSNCFVYPESLGDCSFLNTCFHMDTCKVRKLTWVNH